VGGVGNDGGAVVGGGVGVGRECEEEVRRGGVGGVVLQMWGKEWAGGEGGGVGG